MAPTKTGPSLRDDFLTALSKSDHQIEMLKDRIGSTCNFILSRPEKSLTKLKKLVLLLDIKEDNEVFKLTFITGQKLVAFSTLEVFKDLIPGYRVAEKIKEEDGEKKVHRLKKTTIELRQFETSLLAIYKLYLQRLKRMVQLLRRSKNKVSNFYSNILVTDEARERIGAIGVKCLSELLVTHPHFNYRKDIITMLVPLMTLSKHPVIADRVCEAFGTLFREDKLGEVSLEAVKEIEALIKTCGLFVRPQVIAVFMELKIKEVAGPGKEKKDMKEVRKELNRMSRKEKRRRKMERKLENVLLETEATESTQRRIEFHTKILNHVFVTYFRILKRTIFDLSDDEVKKERFKDLLTPVLEGLSKFCHLINVEFFDDIINILFKLIKSDLLDTQQTLNSCQTVFTILSDEGSALNIDHQRFYTRLYQILPEINLFTSVKTIVILLKCLETMIIKRRKTSFKRTLAFMKRAATVALETNDSATMAFLSFIRRMFIENPRTDILLDNIESTGSGIFMPHIDDPEYCNADATQLWELILLRNHFNSAVGQFAAHILNGCVSQEIRSEIAKKRPIEFYEDNEGKEMSYLFNSQNETRNINKKSRFHGLILESTSLAAKAIKMINNEN